MSQKSVLPEIYPFAFGNEEETSMRFLPGKALPAGILADMLSAYERADKGNIYISRLNTTGGGMYVDREHLELTTPEYATPQELAARIQSHEDTEISLAHTFMQHYEYLGTIGIHRRVVDTRGNTVGSHDNLGLSHIEDLENYVETMMVGHLSTRSFVSGAGYFTRNHVYFAQKAQHVNKLSDYAYNNSMFRHSISEGGSRFEIRCNDININPYASVVRIGSSAIALAIALTPLRKPFERAVQHNLGPSPQSGPQHYNRMPLLPDGSFADSIRLQTAIAYQQRMAETFLSDAMKTHAGDQPADLMRIAKWLYDYCDLMSKIAANEVPYTEAKEYADWAAKTDLIQRNIERQPQGRSFKDEIARRHDMAYDYLAVTRTDDHTTVKKGAGYTLRDRHHAFAGEIDPRIVALAAKRPPENMRAAIRSKFMREYEVTHVDWHKMHVALTPNPQGVTTIGITMPDVREPQIKLSRRSQVLLERYGKRKPAH